MVERGGADVEPSGSLMVVWEYGVEAEVTLVPLRLLGELWREELALLLPAHNKVSGAHQVGPLERKAMERLSNALISNPAHCQTSEGTEERWFCRFAPEVEGVVACYKKPYPHKVDIRYIIMAGAY